MSLPIKKKDSFQIFDAIAGKYDAINSILSAGLHKKWRKKMLPKLPSGNQLTALDLATGTGDVALTLVSQPRVTNVVGLDMSKEMIEVGRKKINRKGLSEKIGFVVGDAQELPFPPRSFEVVTMSFGIRNVPDVKKCLGDALRVLKPGGRMLILEFGLPKSRLLRWAHLFYLRNVLPHIGKLLSGHDFAYRYLNETIETFPYSQKFVDLMDDVGFVHTGYQTLNLGIVNLYWGTKG